MNKKCILPWIHLQVDSDGSARPCCNATKTGDSLGNILQESPVVIWNNTNYQTLRQRMIDGVEPPECKPCYDSERLGLYSKRLRENEDWKHLSNLMDSSVAEFKIRHLDVRFDNVCNFKCRYCSPWLSHSWYNDYKKLGLDVRTEQAINVNGSQLFDIIKEHVVDDLESIFFCCGEPLLMDQHLQILKLLDEKKKYNTKLLYISNLSRLQYKGTDYIELWQKFNDVNVHFSIDTIGTKLEYIRCGAKWESIEENLKRVFSLKDKLKPKMSITVSMFNATEVINTVEYIVGKGYADYTDIALHVVKMPQIYSCQILPNEIKQQITKDVNNFLQKVSLPHFYKSKYEYFINYMNSADNYERYKKEFIDMTAQLDAIRNENFANVFPELQSYYE
jgi:MoaA/NifB/PqqE/SkfB family radical SAM enzyme